MNMDVFGISKNILSDFQGLKNIMREVADICGLNIITNLTASLDDKGQRILVVTDKGDIVIKTFPEREMLMIDCQINDESGLPVAICEYIFQKLGGALNLTRMSAFFERGVNYNASNNPSINIIN